MKQLALQNTDIFALVDEEDYERLSKYKWFYNPNGSIARSHKESYSHKNISLASEVMRRHGVIFDHINRNHFDNQKHNLREASYGKNAMNRSKAKTRITTSKYKGVTLHKRSQRWQAYITLKGKTSYLGYFGTEIEAARAYDKAAVEMFKEFACLNNV